MRNEASRRTGFSRNGLDRQAQFRPDAARLSAMAESADARFVLVAGDRILVDVSRQPCDTQFDRPTAAPWMAGGEPVFLGSENGHAVFAVPALDEPALPDTVKAIDLRSIAMQGLLGDSQTGAAAQARSLVHWHESHRFCSRCGQESAMREGGYRRDCPACGAQHFPRTDPVAIMLAVDGDRCLLGRQARFLPDTYSALAGFIEPGETIEDAVRREVFEESGVRVGEVRYVASQPWPFVSSLMIGCIAEAISREIVIDGEELEDCRWFSREDAAAMIERRHVSGLMVPTPMAIAYTLVRSWVSGETGFGDQPSSG
ncbi:MAG: NAD(+) diphosphatase [Flavobacteriaceae bacterium]